MTMRLLTLPALALVLASWSQVSLRAETTAALCPKDLTTAPAEGSDAAARPTPRENLINRLYTIPLNISTLVKPLSKDQTNLLSTKILAAASFCDRSETTIEAWTNLYNDDVEEAVGLVKRPDYRSGGIGGDKLRGLDLRAAALDAEIAWLMIPFVDTKVLGEKEKTVTAAQYLEQARVDAAEIRSRLRGHHLTLTAKDSFNEISGFKANSVEAILAQAAPSPKAAANKTTTPPRAAPGRTAVTSPEAILNKVNNENPTASQQNLARKMGNDSLLALRDAVTQNETEFQNLTNKHSGASGPMQIMPKTAGCTKHPKPGNLGQQMGVDPCSILSDPDTNIRAGNFYLSQLFDRFGVDRREAGRELTELAQWATHKFTQEQLALTQWVFHHFNKKNLEEILADEYPDTKERHGAQRTARSQARAMLDELLNEARKFPNLWKAVNAAASYDGKQPEHLRLAADPSRKEKYGWGKGAKENHNYIRFILSNAVHLILGTLSSEQPASAAPAAAANDGRILIIGDSHTAQNFGNALDADLRVKNRPVATFAVANSTPKSWLNEERLCYGYRFRGFDGKTTTGKCVGTPQLATLIADHKPAFVIVALGSNGVDDGSVKKVLDQIHKDGARCLWIGPPRMRAREVETIYTLLDGNGIKTTASPQTACRLVDSRQFSYLIPENQDCDPIHYNCGKSAALGTRWGHDAHKALAGVVDES